MLNYQSWNKPHKHLSLQCTTSSPIDAFEKGNNQREKHQKHMTISKLTQVLTVSQDTLLEDAQKSEVLDSSEKLKSNVQGILKDKTELAISNCYELTKSPLILIVIKTRTHDGCKNKAIVQAPHYHVNSSRSRYRPLPGSVPSRWLGRHGRSWNSQVIGLLPSTDFHLPKSR